MNVLSEDGCSTFLRKIETLIYYVAKKPKIKWGGARSFFRFQFEGDK